MANSGDVRVQSISTVCNDGNHNAFTDLCRYGDRIYLTFRSCPDGHMIFPTSRIVVMSNSDGDEWRHEFDFGVADRDTRDPHFLSFGDTLFVYTGTWLCGDSPDINDHLGYCAWTSDGRSWRGPRMLEGTYGHYIWRAAAFGNKAYLCGRRKRDFARTDDSGDGTRVTESAMLRSDDGFVWSHAALFQELYGDETAFLFEDDGAIVGVARGGDNRNAEVVRSRPPYTDWTRRDLGRPIGGPLLAKWGDGYLVGGRKSEEGRGAVTAVLWLVEDALQDISALPSGGDTSYPGFVELTPTEGLLSYYSSHDGSGTHQAPSSIYSARLAQD